jgi:hypothetical protein
LKFQKSTKQILIKKQQQRSSIFQQEKINSQKTKMTQSVSKIFLFFNIFSIFSKFLTSIFDLIFSYFFITSANVHKNPNIAGDLSLFRGFFVLIRTSATCHYIQPGQMAARLLEQLKSRPAVPFKTG